MVLMVVLLGFSSRAQNDIIKNFKNPDGDAKPMLRWWFPSADYDASLVKQQIEDAYNAGFGGVEVAMVPHYTSFDAKVDGWGTPKWKDLMKFILKNSNSLPGKFKVDFTITAHWPPSLNTIDPNDDATSQELAHTIQKITSSGIIPLELPETKTKDRDGTPFIFTDSYVASSIAKVLSVNGNIITVEEASLKDVSSYVSAVVDEKGNKKYTKAGIPDNATSFGDKPKLNDKQYTYQIDIDLKKLGISITELSSGGKDIKASDWLLFSYFHRGTGQSISGMGMMNLFLPMADGMYATSYYDSKGTQAIIDFWNEQLLSDEELLTLLKSNGGDIFEDSIESASKGPFWTSDFLEQFKSSQNINLVSYMPFIATDKGSKLKFISDAGIEKKIVPAYHQELNQLYINEHIKLLQDFTKKFGYGYRAQAYGASIETSEASALLDVSEGESLGFGNLYDQFRNISGGVNMAEKKFVSDEILADLGAAYKITWKSSAATLNSNFAAGVNRAIFHGMAYPVEPSHKFNDWPGWHPFQAAFADPWDHRQAYWDHVSTVSGFVSRNQAVLQSGSPKMDIAIYKSQLNYGYGFEELLENGYSYDIIGTSLLMHPNAILHDRKFAPASYKAIVVNTKEEIPAIAVEKLVSLAKQGLPIVVVDNGVTTNLEGLFSIKNVIQVTKENLVDTLLKLGVKPEVSYSQKGLWTRSRLAKDGSMAHFIFNNNEEDVAVTLSLAIKGNSYILDAWTGNVYSIASRAGKHGEELIDVKLSPKQSLILAISPTEIPSLVTEYPYFKDKKHSTQLVNWKLAIESKGPAGTELKYQTKTTHVDLGKIKLGSWDNLLVSDKILQKLGVDSMKQVSGQAEYTTNFQLDKNWIPGNPVFLEIKHGDDMITQVIINDHVLKNIDATTDRVEIGSLLKEKNNLKIQLATTLINRVKVEHEIFKNGFGLPGPPAGLDVEPVPNTEAPENFPALPVFKNDFSYGIYEVSIKY